MPESEDHQETPGFPWRATILFDWAAVIGGCGPAETDSQTRSAANWGVRRVDRRGVAEVGQIVAGRITTGPLPSQNS